MTRKEREEILEVLKEKGVAPFCSRCGWTKLSVIGEHTLCLDQKSTAGKSSPYIRTILVSCMNCGAVTQHRKDALGISDAGE